MTTFREFADWAGSQAKAGQLIGVNKLRAHRLYHGAAIRADEALRIEQASEGLFPKESFLWGIEHTGPRREAG